MFSVAYIALTAVAISYGGGKHSISLEPYEISQAILFVLIAFIPGLLSFTIPKFAVVILLSKILNPGPMHRTIMWIVSIAYGLLVVVTLIINFAQCSPAATQWGKAQGTCWDRRIIVDCMLAVGSEFFPLPLLYASLLFSPSCTQDLLRARINLRKSPLLPSTFTSPRIPRWCFHSCK